MHSLFKGNHRRVQGYHMLAIRQNARTTDRGTPKLCADMVQTTKSQILLGDNGSKISELLGNLTTGTSKQMVLTLFCNTFGHTYACIVLSHQPCSSMDYTIHTVPKQYNFLTFIKRSFNCFFSTKAPCSFK
jgi:hypothetical protein